MTLRLPHWKWFLFVTIPLVVVAVIMPFALPIYGQHVAIREIERLKGIVTTEKGGPMAPGLAWRRDNEGLGRRDRSQLGNDRHL